MVFTNLDKLKLMLAEKTNENDAELSEMLKKRGLNPQNEYKPMNKIIFKKIYMEYKDML